MIENQKSHQIGIQKLINHQARLITGMYPSTPIEALINESGLVPAHVLLDFVTILEQIAFCEREYCCNACLLYFL